MEATVGAVIDAKGFSLQSGLTASLILGSCCFPVFPLEWHPVLHRVLLHTSAPRE